MFIGLGGQDRMQQQHLAENRLQPILEVRPNRLPKSDGNPWCCSKARNKIKIKLTCYNMLKLQLCIWLLGFMWFTLILYCVCQNRLHFIHVCMHISCMSFFDVFCVCMCLCLFQFVCLLVFFFVCWFVCLVRFGYWFGFVCLLVWFVYFFGLLVGCLVLLLLLLFVLLLVVL